MIPMHCKLCGTPVGLPLQQFHQIEDGYWCHACATDEAHFGLLGWFFRWLTHRRAVRTE